VLVALDYAYWEYVTAADLPDPMALMREFGNVVVLRTFSKIYGLAGLRVGYAVSSPDIVSTLEKVRQPFNINSMALVAAEAALGDRVFIRRSRGANQQGMRFWEKGLTKIGIPFWKSQGNFILADVEKGLGMKGPEVYTACLKTGVILRPVANYGLANAIRISVGTSEENQVALTALGSLAKGKEN
jgi:histidinol-phosphate aminotransferase